MDLQLKDRVVVVTGGTGDIGRAIVRAFIDEGAIVHFTYARADAKARELAEAFPERAHAHKVSVLDGPALDRTATAIVDLHGRLDILVNNAGIAQVLPFPLIEEAEWDELMDVNVKGVFLATRAFVRPMIKRRSGSVVNLGSVAGERIMEVPVHYATSKAAITGFTLSLAKELSRYEIRVNCVVPGLIEGGVSRNTPDKQKNQYLEHSTVKRLGRPEEVADLIAFIASGRCGYLNGQIVHVDGGI